MFVPLYLMMRGRELGTRWRAFAGATYALAAVTMVLSLSRGNWLAFAAAHGVFFLMVDRRILIGGMVTAALLLTVGFGLLPALVRDRIQVTTETTGHVVYQVPLALNLESSTASRIVFARIGLDMFERSPIWGHGLHAFNFRTPEFGAKYGILVQKDPHNLAVKMAADAGLIGLGVLGWLIWSVFRCGRRLWRSTSPEYLLGAVLLAAATHVLVANMSATSFLYAKQISAQFWILFAIAARAYVERDAEQEEPAAQPVLAGRWRRFAQRTAPAVSQL
jgi:O-antigen ligase